MDNLGSIESGKVTIKVLTTNSTSLTLLTDDKFGGKVIQPGVSGNKAMAEHGLAMSISIRDGEKTYHFLLDAGSIAETIFENMKQFKTNINEFEKVILSHGHFDHFGGLNTLIPQLTEGCEFYLNPTCYRQNHMIVFSDKTISPEELGTSLRKLKKEGLIKDYKKLPPLMKNKVENLTSQYGIKVIETTESVKLHEGVITSGEIELFDENEMTKGGYLEKGKNIFEKHTFRDETTIYINIKEKGLVVITGCGHTGIVNTIKHGQKITGIEKIYAIIGGLHKEHESPENLEATVKFIEDLDPEITCGMHCTGFEFNKLMSRHRSHTLGIVGTEFHL